MAGSIKQSAASQPSHTSHDGSTGCVSTTICGVIVRSRTTTSLKSNKSLDTLCAPARPPQTMNTCLPALNYRMTYTNITENPTNTKSATTLIKER
jgi:hypothetical protein